MPDLHDVARLQMPHHLTERQAMEMTPAEWYELEVTGLVPERIFQLEPHPMGVPHRNINQDENPDHHDANAHQDENPGTHDTGASTS